MARIRSGHTKPELSVRRSLHRLGYRFRVHWKDLPGKPDVVFSRRRKVIFIHGCFWHQHAVEACLDGRKPKSNTAYWDRKLERNVERDRQHIEKLTAKGWDVLIIWECELDDASSLERRLQKFLGPTRVS